MKERSTLTTVPATVGIDLGDRRSHVCVLHDDGVIEEATVATTPEATREFFGSRPRCRVVMEAGTHSPWKSRMLSKMGFDVIVADPRRLRLLTESNRKCDRLDALTLARLGRAGVDLLHRVHHRSEQTQLDLNVLRARDVVVRSRTKLINHVRSEVKAAGGRIVGVSPEGFGARSLERVPAALHPALAPLIEEIASLTALIRRYDRQVEKLCEKYPATALLRQIPGVGPVTALAFVLTIEDPKRFGRSRVVAAYLGLVPRRDQSGSSDRQLPITKAGDRTVRRLLVGSAQYLLGPFGPDTALRRFGQALAQRGGRNAKKRAVVAVARKLSVLLHRLWVSGENYERLRAARPLATASPGIET
jgi:transposase